MEVFSVLSLAEQIKEIAYPIAIAIFFIMQKLDAMKADARRDAIKRALDESTIAHEKAAEDVRRTAVTTAEEVKRKLDEQNRATEIAAAEVKRQLEKDSAVDRLKLEEIHIDVNSKMAAQKKKTWDFALLLATRADATPADHAAAREAEKDYLDHVEAQKRADERVRLFIASQLNANAAT